MKKLIVIITIFFLSLSLLGYQYLWTSTDSDVFNKVIRFHVIANSDLEEDQNLKLKVRDEVLKYIHPKLKESKSLEQSRIILNEHSENIKELSKKVIEKNGYDYSVDVKLIMDNFPVKTYGSVTLPQGRYEAYKIIIGEGKGQNWWCVMFPPLCFIDITKGEVDIEKTRDVMNEFLDQENEIQLKFKGIEVIKNIINKATK